LNVGAGASARALQVAWLTVFAAAIGGYAGIVAPGEREARALLAQSRNLYDLANRNDAALAQRATLVRLRDRVRRDLAELGTEKTAARAALALIEVLERQGKRRNVALASFAPDDTADTGDAQRISLTLRGAYEDLLPLVSDLSRYRPLVRVEDASLTRPSGASDGSEIDAQVHVTLYHAQAGLVHSNLTETHANDPAPHR